MSLLWPRVAYAQGQCKSTAPESARYVGREQMERPGSQYLGKPEVAHIRVHHALAAGEKNYRYDHFTR